MFRRLYALITKEFIQLSRDLFFVIVILLGPASELVAVGYATGAEIKHLPMAVCDYDQTPASRALVEQLVNTDTFDVAAYTATGSEIIPMLDRGTVYAGIVIPPDFGADLASGSERPPVQVLLNGAESAAAQAALDSVQGAVDAYSITYIQPQLAALAGSEQIQPSVRVWYNESLRKANYTIPSELGFILYVIALWVAALSISRERELGTLEQLMVTPLRRLEMVIGKSVPAVVLSYINFLLMLSLTLVVFKIPLRGSPALLLGLAFFYILVELQRGLLISALSRTQQQGLLTVFLMAFLDLTFSGYAVPVESMPPILQTVANIFPIRHWLIIMRGIMLKGAGLDVFWPHVLAIAALGLVMTLATVLVFQRTLND